MPNSRVAALMPLTGVNVTNGKGNDYRQLACGPVFAAGHVNAAIDSVVPTLSSLVGGSKVDTLMYNSSTAEAATSVIAYRDSLRRGARAVVGPPYSSIAKYLALLGGIDQVPMCSYWASAPSLSDHAYFGRTYPSDEIATQALPEMIKALGWTNVAVIHISDAYGIAFAEGLRSNSQTCGVNVRATFDFDELNADSIRVAVKNLALMASRDGVNIFVAISTSPTDLSTIFYEAEEQDIVGDGFAWLTTDSVNARVAIEKAPDQARARRLMDGAINFYASPAGSPGYARFSNAWTSSTDADCANDVFNASQTGVFSSKPFVNAAFAYDCVVALAAAMHSAGENATGSAVFEAFTNVSFEGATGTVAFGPNGDRLASTVRYAVDVWRINGSELLATNVGSFTNSSGYTSSDDSITWPKDTYAPPDASCSAKDYEPVVSDCEGMRRTVKFSWTAGSNCTIGRALETEGGVRPVDTAIDCEYLQRDQPVVYVMYSLAGLAMLLFVVALVLLVRLRHAPAVRLGQPIFLFVMAVGGVVALVPIFLIPGEPGSTNCFAPTVVTVFGFSLTFGCLLLKTYRIYRIWEAAQLLKRIALTERSMAWRLCLLLLIDAVVLVAWGLVARPRATVELEEVSGVGLVAMKSCTSGPASNSFLAGAYLYKMALTLVMCIMAFHTRNMSADFSEGKFLFISSHELLFCSLIIVPLTHTKVTASYKYAMQSIGLLLVTVCFSLTLGTKIRLALMGTTATEEASRTVEIMVSEVGLRRTTPIPRCSESSDPSGSSEHQLSEGNLTRKNEDDHAALVSKVDLLSAHNAVLEEQIKVLTKAGAAPPTRPAASSAV